MRRFNILVISFLLVFIDGTAQEKDSIAYYSHAQKQEINKARLMIVGGSLLTSMAAIHIYQQNGWWKNNRASFHFQEDLNYGLWVDKLGHFYGGALLAFIMSKSLEWANISEKNAIWISAGGSLLFQTYVEMEDGFSKWGFDRVDWGFDIGGAFWNPVRYYIPFLRNFDLKFSYHPSELLGSSKGIGFRGQHHIMIDDYEGQTFWLGIKVKNLIPDAWKNYYPSFLGVAFGYAARNVADENPYKIYFIGLDLDMTEIIPDNTPFLKAIGEALNFIHFPMPAIQFSLNKTIWYGLYF